MRTCELIDPGYLVARADRFVQALRLARASLATAAASGPGAAL